MNDFARLLEAEIPRLRRYARALTRDVARADDLVQSCLTRAVAKQHLWQPGTDLRAWLFTILHNLAADQFRRASSRGRHVPIEEAGEGEFRGAAAQEHRLMYQDVLDKLARLPEEQRAVLLLVAVEDLSYAEAAKVLNVPIGTVMSRLSRARERLQQELDGVADAPGNVVTMRRLT
jgi:RNA polymerase sigma-70 factor (ECF subfamily)